MRSPLRFCFLRTVTHTALMSRTVALLQRMGAFAFVLVLNACSKADPPDESALRAEDKRQLEHVVAIDVRASKAMRDADDATHLGDAGAATDFVANRARPAVDEALRAANGTTMRTAWGTTMRTQLLEVLRDRAAEMPAYEEAITSRDPEKMLIAVQAQAAIERRALETVGKLQAGR